MGNLIFTENGLTYCLDELADKISSQDECATTRINGLEGRMHQIEMSVYQFAKAMEQVKANFENFKAAIEPKMTEETEPQNQNDPGDFWTKIAKENMFLQDLI